MSLSDIDVYLNQLLKGSPPPTTVGLNIFPDSAFPNQAGQYCVYQVVSQIPILTQEGDPEGLRTWRYQFKCFGPSYFATRRDCKSIRDFLVGFKDPSGVGITNVTELSGSPRSLPTSSAGRLFCRMTELEIRENLP